uniref:Uncharacterized protein n=1 Tax=Heliothis virescens TaxID=7102 RepID=A0A2A4JME4_HELVI
MALPYEENGLFYVHGQQDYNANKFNPMSTAAKAPTRLLELMRSYYEEANVRIAAMNEQRFMYEESPFYEQGYLMHEIIERFRKLVEHAKFPTKHNHTTVMDTLDRCEKAQKLYFEIYHLVRMMHETPLKWRYLPEFRDTGRKPNASDGLAELYAAQLQIQRMHERRERERRKRKKKYALLRNLYLKGLSQDYSGKKKQRPNRHWPLDYGWEVDFNW